LYTDDTDDTEKPLKIRSFSVFSVKSVYQKGLITAIPNEPENKCQTRPVNEGIPFLGFLIHPEYRRLKRKRGLAFQRKYKAALKAYQCGELPFEKLTASVQGWVNHVRYANTWRLRLAILTPLITDR
jgi:hypothetical protein